MVKLRDILFENPDDITGYNINSNTKPNYAFGYLDGDICMGEVNKSHYYIFSGKHISRSDFFLPGRLWPLEKIISFWIFPSSYELDTTIKDLNKLVKDRNLNFSIDNTWEIDTISINGKEKLVNIRDYINQQLSPKKIIGINSWYEI